MKRLCVGLVFLLCSVSLHAQKTRMGQELPFAKRGVAYPIMVHISGIHVRPVWEEGYSVNIIFADITSNGRKLELQCGSGIPENPYKNTPLLSFGDFHARVLKNGSGNELGDGYELLLPDNRVLGCAVSGMVE